jgi:hypothetical protein
VFSPRLILGRYFFPALDGKPRVFPSEQFLDLRFCDFLLGQQHPEDFVAKQLHHFLRVHLWDGMEGPVWTEASVREDRVPVRMII